MTVISYDPTPQKRRPKTVILFWTEERIALLKQMSRDHLCPAVMAVILETTETKVRKQRTMVGCQAAHSLGPRNRQRLREVAP